MRKNKHLSTALVCLVAAFLAGCESIPADQLGKYGVVIPDKNGYNDIFSVDKEQVFGRHGTPVNISPGEHTIEHVHCRQLDACGSAFFTFVIEAGKAYQLHQWESADIEVYDRFNIKGGPIGKLHKPLNATSYIDDADFAKAQAYNQQMAGLQAEAQAKNRAMMTSQLNLALRGTQICRVVPNDIGQTTVSGFIEDHAGDKLQIQIAGLNWSTVSQGIVTQHSINTLNIGGMQWQNGSIIYDQTSNWSLCE